MILGIPDLSVLAAYLLSFLITVVCVVYGIIHWNNDGVTKEELEEEKEWKQEDEKMEEKLSIGGEK